MSLKRCVKNGERGALGGGGRDSELQLDKALAGDTPQKVPEWGDFLEVKSLEGKSTPFPVWGGGRKSGPSNSLGALPGTQAGGGRQSGRPGEKARDQGHARACSP